MSFKCSLIPAISSIEINDYLYNNKIVNNLNDFYSDIAKILFEVEGDLRTVIDDYKVGDEKSSNFGSYLPGVSEIIQTQIPLISKNLGRGQTNYTAVSSLDIYELADNIGRAVLNKIEQEKIVNSDLDAVDSKSILETKDLKEEDISESNEWAVLGTESSVIDHLEELGINLNSEGFNSRELPFDKFANIYFNEYPELLSGFEVFFKNNFYSQLVRNNITNGVEPQGYNPDIQSVLENTLELITKQIDKELLSSSALESLLDSSNPVINSYYASIIKSEFDNVVSYFLPGVQVNKGEIKYSLLDGSEGVRTGFKNYDGAFSGFDQISHIMKMHIYTTPRLKFDGKNGLIQDTDNPYLKDYEVKVVANELNSLPADLEGFRAGLESLSRLTGTKGSIFKSLYTKFFDTDPYTLNGQDYVSFYTLAKSGDANINNILNALITSFRSQQNLEHVIVNNDNVTITKNKNVEVAAIIEEDYLLRLTNPSNKAELNPSVAKNIKVIETVDGFEIVLGNKFTISLQGSDVRNNTNGVLVRIAEESVDQFRVINNAVQALSMVGLPDYLGSRFVNYYNDNIEDFAKSSTAGKFGMSMPNLIANFAYIAAMNDPKSREILSKHNFAIPESKASGNIEQLSYPPVEHIYAFMNAIVNFAEDTEGLTAKKTRINGDGNVVSSTGVNARIYDTPNYILELRDKPNTIHRNNTFVKENYVIDGFASKDGITKFGDRKSNSKMSRAEQYKYLIEDVFLKAASQNNFKKALIQPGVMSDRSLVELVMVSSRKGNEFLPKNINKRDINGANQLMREFITDQKFFHNDLAGKITDKWKEQLISWGYDVNSITDIFSLDNYLKSNSISIDKAKSSNLVSELMYVDYNGNAHIKSAFLEMYKIWNDNTLAIKFSNRMFRKFKSDLRREGFNEYSLSLDAVSVLKDRFGVKNKKQAFKSLVESYFYQSNIIANAFMNLNMGSIYQFKGDLNLDKVRESAGMKRFKDNLDQSTDLTAEEKESRFNVGVASVALDEALNSMFVNQAKRNAGLGSSFQHPTLVTSDEKGALLDYDSNVALLEDPKIMVKLLGKLNSNTSQEIYDAVQMGHPLYFLKLNNSLGNEYSGFTSKGGAVKDITNEVDPDTGALRFQKKATFNSFSNEMLRKGSPELHRLFRKMNESVNFKSYAGENLVYNNKEYSNLQELWESFGAYENENSWVEVLNVLSENPKFRNAYVQKIGFKSAEKTGNRAVNNSDIWSTNDNLLWTPVSNTYHGVILNGDHDPDTFEADKSLMTQVISAAIFQGETADLAKNINEALLSLADISLDRIQQEVYNNSLDILLAKTNKASNDLPADLLVESRSLLNRYYELNNNEQNRLKEIINTTGIYKKAMKNYARKLAEEAVKTRESFGIVTDLVDESIAGLDSMQLQNIVHSAVMAKLNKDTTRIKFKGQELIVSASHDFLQLYKLPNGIEVNREEYIKSNLTKYSVIDSIEKLNSLVATDVVKFNGVEMPLWKVLRENKDIIGNNLEAKLLPQGRSLKWTNYTNKDGINVSDTIEYRNLLELNDLVQNSKNPSEKSDLTKAAGLAKAKLLDLLSDPDQKWIHGDAEFYMPMMHMKSFNLNKPGSDEPDNINITDIMGDEKTGGLVYVKNGNIVPTNGDITGAEQIYESEYNHMKKFFRKRIKLHRDKYNFKRFANLSELSVGDFKKLLQKYSNKSIALEVGSIEYDMLSRELSVLKKYNLPADLEDTQLIAASVLEEINQVRSINKDYYINQLAEKQARNFVKTLNVLAARIPGQGKQSYTAGKIKGFVTSTRNAIYGPVEMLTITGADHDYDKSHVLVYSFDKDGNFYDYSKFLDKHGRLSKKIYNDYLNQKVNQHVGILKAEGKDLEFINKAVEKLKKVNNEYLTEAIKNYILDNLIDGIRDPRNAVEAATPVSMDKLKAQIEKASEIETDEEGSVIVSDDSMVSPFNPASIPNLELVNAAGKDGVGIFATGLKGYAAAYSAWLDDMNSPFIKFGDESTRLFGNSRVLLDLFDRYYSVSKENNNNSLNFYAGQTDGSVKRISRKYLANTDKFSTEGADSENKYKKKVKDLVAQGLSSTEIDQILVDDFDRLMSLNHKIGVQAWEDISELLSAATDNAKELILGRIGATSDTSGIIVAGLIVGFDLSDVLPLLNDPEVKDIIKTVEDSRDTTKNRNRSKSANLEDSLSRYLKKKFGKDNKNIISRLTDLTNEVNNLRSKKDNNFGVLSSDTQKLKYNLKGFSDITLSSPSTGVSVDVSGVNKVVVSESNPSDLELIELQQLAEVAKLNFNILNHSKANSIVKALRNSDLILLVEGLNSTEKKLSEAYAKVNAKELFRIGDRGNLYKYNAENDNYSPYSLPLVLGNKTSIVSHKDFSPIMLNAFAAIVSNTKLLLEEPVKYNELVETLNANLNAELELKENKLKNELNGYLSNGPRQLLQLSKISKELRAVTSLLSINQGLPNSDFDVYKYFNNFAKIISSDKFEFTPKQVYEFIDSINEDGVYANKVIESYDKIKSGINPFYILAKNKHYFGYIKSLRFGQELVRNSTFTNEVIENVITLTKASPSDKAQYDEFKNYVYGVGIELFFNKYNYNNFKIAGNTYDLTSNSDRYRFMKEMVGITLDFQKDPNIKANPFVSALRLFNIKDAKTDTLLEAIRTLDLNNLTDTKKAKLRLGLKQLKNLGLEYEQLHNALFLYSLILNKGSRGKTSFSALFDLETDAFRNYIEFLNNTVASDLMNPILNMGNLAVSLNVPSSIPEIDTVPKAISSDLYEEDFMDEVEYTTKKINKNASVEDRFYSLPSNTKYTPTLFKSRQTGKYYLWNDEHASYVVLSSTQPLKTIPFSTNKVDSLEAAGFQWGESAIVDSNGTIGQVYKYDNIDNNYIVKIGNNAPIRMTSETLADFNPDMIFRGRNFGKLSVQDKNNTELNKVVTGDESESIKFRLSIQEIKSVINGSMKYKVVTDLPVNVKIGDTIDTIKLNNELSAKLIYKGVFSNDKAYITQNLGNVRPGSLSGKFKNKEVDKLPIVEIQLTSTPHVINADVPQAHASTASKLGGRIAERIRQNRAAFFSSTANLNIDKGETKLVKFTDPKDFSKSSWFKITNNGAMSDYSAENSLDNSTLYEMLGYSGNQGRAIVSKMLAVNSGYNFYSVEPYNAKSQHTNSYHEYRFLDSTIEPNLLDTRINLVDLNNNNINNNFVSELNKFGVKDINIIEHVSLSEEGNSILEKTFRDKADLLPEGSSNISDFHRKLTNTILESDSVFIIDDFSHIKQKDIARLNFSVEQRLSNEQEKIIQILNRNSIANHVEYLQEVLNNIEDNNLDQADSIMFKSITSDNAKLARIVDSTIEVLSKPSNIPPYLKNYNFSKTFIAGQVAKHANKPLHIFSPARQQWYKYNPVNGDFEASRIPIIEGTAAIINPELSDNIARQGVDSLLKKTSQFKKQQLNGLGTLRGINEITFGSGDINSEINTPISTSLVFNEIPGVIKIDNFEKSVLINDGTEYAKATDVNGETFLEQDFVDFSEDTKINRFSDGTISIESTKNNQKYFWAFFPDEKIRKDYADYSGDKIVDNFKIKFNNEYLIFNKLHRTDKEAFLRRDQLISEKQQIKKLFNDAQQIYNEKVGPLYSSIRYENLSAAEKYQHYDSYSAFMLHLFNNNLEIDPKHLETVELLKKAHNEYKNKHNEAWEFYRKVRDNSTFSVPRVNGIKESFFDTDKTDNDILVFITDNIGSHKSVDKRIKNSTRAYLEKNKTGIQNPTKDGIRAYGLPLLFADQNLKNANFRSNSKAAVRKSFARLADIARNNPAKTFYVELPSNISDNYFESIRNIDILKLVADAISQEKTKGIPSNIIFSNGSQDLLNKFRGGLNPENINTTVPFSITNDITEENIFDIDRYSIYNQRIGKFTINELWKLERGYSKDANVSIEEEPLVGSEAYNFGSKYGAFKSLWRKWAEANPEKFEQMAMMVGSKTLYDAYYSDSKDISTGKALAELLTEKFVDNSWIDYPRSILNISNELREGQNILPVSKENTALLKFTSREKGGKTILTINGKAYLARIEQFSVKPSSSLEVALLEKMGLGSEENPLQIISEEYPFTDLENYSLLNLTEFKNELKESKPVKAGVFSEVLQAANVNVSDEHLNLASKATIAYGIDTRARITDDISNSITGTDWIREYKRAIGDGIVLDITSEDKVWFYGSTLEDGNNPETIKGVAEATKILVDKVIGAKAEILIGKNSGIEEELRSYIMHKEPGYTMTEDGFAFKKPFSTNMKSDIEVWKAGNKVARFNANNILGRESSNLTGAWGTILYKNTDAAKVNTNAKMVSNYRLAISEDEIVDWNAGFNPEKLIDLIGKLDLEVVENNIFKSIRGALLIGEQRFIKRLFAVSIFSTETSAVPLYSVDELDLHVDKLIESNEDFAKAYNELVGKMFKDSGQFNDNISDVAAMAMARNRNITINYVKELIPEAFNKNLETHPYFELINSERVYMDKSKSYFRMLNENSISNSDLELIKNSKGLTYRDAYNFLKTLGSEKIISENANISGQLVNKLFVNDGVKAFVDGDKYIVLDNDIVLSNKSGGNSVDYNKVDKYKTNEIDIKLAQFNPKIYRYLKTKNMFKVDPYTDEIRIIVNDRVNVYNADNDGYKKIVQDTLTQVGLNYFNKLSGVHVDEEFVANMLKDPDYKNVLNMINSHIKYKRSLKSDNFSMLFISEPKGKLITNVFELENGAVYLDDSNNRLFAMKDAAGWFMQSINGELFRLSGGEWELQTGINNKEFSYLESLNNSIASPRAIGEIFDSIITVNNEQLYGEFEVSEKVENVDGLLESEVIVTNNENGKIYKWETFANAWTPVESAALLGSEFNIDTEINPGQKVISLNTAAGNILLYNGKALDKDTVIDDKGTYKRNAETNVWSIIETKGGFNNPNIKFQKTEINYVNAEGKSIASKRVSKSTMRLVFNDLFKNTNIGAELMTSLDIQAEYGARYMDASGFVRNGKIVINLDKATLDTPLHEFAGHIYLAHLKNMDLEAYNEIIKKCLEHDIKDKIKALYPENNDEELGGEIFSTLMGLENQTKLEEKSLNLWQKIIKIANDSSSIIDFFRKAFDSVFGSNDYEYELDLNDSLLSIIGKIGDNIIFGNKSVLNNLTDDQMENLKFATNPVINEAEVEEKLNKLGFIKTICV
jgi:hypothetical protein